MPWHCFREFAVCHQHNKKYKLSSYFKRILISQQFLY
jgi:hypothetical protein